jgi:hypothetical protein
MAAIEARRRLKAWRRSALDEPFLGYKRKISAPADCVVVEAVDGEPVSSCISLINGKIQGISAKMEHCATSSIRLTSLFQ